MNITLPDKTLISIYSKSNCKNCNIIKDIFNEYNIKYIEINCDEYLRLDREEFIKQMNILLKTNIDTIIQFPIVFDKETLIGTYDQTIQYIKNNLEFYENF